MNLIEQEPYTTLSISIGNEEGELDRLYKQIGFKAKPKLYSTLHLFHDADCSCWRYILVDNDGSELDKRTLSDDEFTLVYDRFRILADLVTPEEQQHHNLLIEISNLIQEDYELKSKVESVISGLIERNEITLNLRTCLMTC